ncbi:type I restriction endonuclease subunit R [uncultured Clostridium sp.]|uniref:type I restriction endonuclease subunit R n=1 Tax=uncultured Clostridium sp. TaxID=59620 RepID=UPI00261E1AF2|nr:type I restriction endonuclease subunit R [uncultured Clostridium sp.]
MSHQPEWELENLMIEQLIGQGFEKIKIKDEESLINNFRHQLFLQNKEKLNDIPFTDKEFEKIMLYIGGKGVFDSAKILRDKYTLVRDNGKKVYLYFFNYKRWCNNIFQVTNQTSVEGTYKNRYDITILINGLPLVQIELKRRGLDMTAAFDQIVRYKSHSYMKALYRFIQIFVVSNGVDTKYFCNNDGKLNKEFMFFWTDDKNKRITNLKDFTMSFFERNFIAKIIARYMVVNDTEKLLMVMRPYQIYAVESIERRTLETNNNGYIWHTTGSGKTLTSFKGSQILANEKNIKKVFFLIDRKDLDSQTVKEFNKFEKDSVDLTKNTRTLIDNIQNADKRFIVTTIQKLANAIDSPKYEKVLEKYKEEKVIFVIDECHRSQFGDMHKSIKKYFANAQYFGFTGTPILQENIGADGRSTKSLFDKKLHNYLIKDAIADGNVLGFSIDYINTIKGYVYEDNNEKVAGIDTKEAFMDSERLESVAKHIISIHNNKTRHKEYCAIFAVQDIPMLIKYYDIFKSLNSDLKITGIFTYGQNEDSEGKDEHSRESLERIIADYNKTYSSDYNTDKFQAYSSDVQKKLKTGKIDIVLVVNMFLTGFDSKLLNTLYVDKNLRYHGLLQAFSRTNRVYKPTKPFGNIVCYRNLKENTDKALKLFSDSDNIESVLTPSKDYLETAFKLELDRLYSIAKTPSDLDNIQSEEQKKEFILAFRDLSKILVKLNTFIDFELDTSNIGIDEQTYEDFKSKYLGIYDTVKRQEKQKESILNDIDFVIELVQTDKINVDYILNLIRNIDRDNKEKQKEDIEYILKELEKADNEELRYKVDLLREFLNRVVPEMNPTQSMDEALELFKEVKKEEEIQTLSTEVGLDKEKIKNYVDEYEFSGMIDTKDINSSLKVSFKQKRTLASKIKTFIMDCAHKFSL